MAALSVGVATPVPTTASVATVASVAPSSIGDMRIEREGTQRWLVRFPDVGGLAEDDPVTVQGVKKGAVKEMKTAQGAIDIYEVEDLHEDMQDMLADVEELNEVMGRSYDTYNGVDEADLDAALMGLDDELRAD